MALTHLKNHSSDTVGFTSECGLNQPCAYLPPRPHEGGLPDHLQVMDDVHLAVFLKGNLGLWILQFRIKNKINSNRPMLDSEENVGSALLGFYF